MILLIINQNNCVSTISAYQDIKKYGQTTSFAWKMRSPLKKNWPNIKLLQNKLVCGLVQVCVFEPGLFFCTISMYIPGLPVLSLSVGWNEREILDKTLITQANCSKSRAKLWTPSLAVSSRALDFM